MSKYKRGEKIPDLVNLIRRIFPRWIREDDTISSEAFQPRRHSDGSFEKGVSVQIKDLIKKPFMEDRWTRIYNCKVGQIMAEIPNQLGYPVIYTSKDHANISGGQNLYYDDGALLKLAYHCDIIFDPEDND